MNIKKDTIAPRYFRVRVKALMPCYNMCVCVWERQREREREREICGFAEWPTSMEESPSVLHLLYAKLHATMNPIKDIYNFID